MHLGLLTRILRIWNLKDLKCSGNLIKAEQQPLGEYNSSHVIETQHVQGSPDLHLDNVRDLAVRLVEFVRAASTGGVALDNELVKVRALLDECKSALQVCLPAGPFPSQ